MTICRIYQTSPFEIFNADIDEVIMLINYQIEKGKDLSKSHHETYQKQEERIRVNDKTATGGWY